MRLRYLASFLWILIFGLAVAQVAAHFLLDMRRVPPTLAPTTSTLTGAIALLAMCTVGWLIAVRRPHNPVGWLMIGVAFTGATLPLPGIYAAYAVALNLGLSGAYWLYWLSQITWFLLFGELLVLLPLFFPDGRLLSRRWLAPIALLGITLLVVIVASLDPRATDPLPNPLGVKALSGLVGIFNSPVFTVYFFLLCSVGIVSLIVRYRRGAKQERQQLKWLLAAVVLLLLLVFLQVVVVPLSDAPLLPIGAALLPIAIGIAVLRNRLYDIDLIINKALVYGGLAAVITAAYVLVVVGIGALVGNSRQFLLSIVTTAVIALAFQPLRHRAQGLANRLVYGKRATPYETLSQFSEHLSETFSHEDILDRMSRILAQGTGAERAEVWVRAGPRLLLASSSPPLNGSAPPELSVTNGNLPPMERDRVAPVTHQGELLGALAVSMKRGETLNAVEQKLVTDLAGQAGLVLKNVGLNRELLARLEDLRASRQRLVSAQDEERRRLERNIHDGAQQHLVALKVKLGVAESLSEPNSRARPVLAQLKNDADEALVNLRELARGIYPPLLASEGLPAALKSHARRLPFAVELDVDRVQRLSREAEGAVYFCCLEALQNVAKYASATRVEVRARVESSTLAFSVSDNGKGFDPATTVASSGLQNMRDRLEALGGTLQVESEPGKGTRIEGQLPV